MNTDLELLEKRIRRLQVLGSLGLLGLAIALLGVYHKIDRPQARHEISLVSEDGRSQARLSPDGLALTFQDGQKLSLTSSALTIHEKATGIETLLSPSGLTLIEQGRVRLTVGVSGPSANLILHSEDGKSSGSLQVLGQFPVLC